MGIDIDRPSHGGSNADEATVFGHNDLKSVGDYKRHLREDTGQYLEQEFELYPANSDAEVKTRSIQLESDEFACGAYSIAQAMTKARVPSYLYYFTYVDPGKRSKLGAHHGEELFFLSDSFPIDWEHTSEDQKLGKLIRDYWVQFVKTGNPNFDNVPNWPPYGKSSEYFELGEHVGSRPVPPRIRALESIMRRVVADQQ
jgi:para-nitrobenzyl esterase